MTTYINGNNGRYDNKITNPSVRYGRNSVDNYINYLEKPLTNDNYPTPPILEFDMDEASQERNAEKLENYINKNDEYIKSLPPLEYEYRYMPYKESGKIDKEALLGAAYEEMRALEYPVKDFEKNFIIDNTYTAEPLDIDKNGKIDIAEYSTNILAADMLSKPEPDISKVDGTINSKGFNAVIEYTKKARAAEASKLYGELYRTYNLGSAYDSFKADTNNTIK